MSSHPGKKPPAYPKPSPLLDATISEDKSPILKTETVKLFVLCEVGFPVKSSGAPNPEGVLVCRVCAEEPGAKEYRLPRFPTYEEVRCPSRSLELIFWIGLNLLSPPPTVSSQFEDSHLHVQHQCPECGDYHAWL